LHQKNKRQEYTNRFFQIKIGTTWRTVAELVRNPFDVIKGSPKFDLYFLDYGVAHAGNYGNDSVGIYSDDWYMTIEEAVKVATPIVQKKLYKIATGIMDGLNVESDEQE